MKLLEAKSLSIEAVKVIRFGRFADDRGYFTEHFRRSDFHGHEDLDFMRGVEFLQANESHSRANVVRGLHFQWNPYMGKLVRTVAGRMVDMVLDIRKGSPTCGKIICYDMPADREADYQEWIWVPPGFAHGNFFTEESLIEYFCSGEYSPGCEAGISPLAPDIDWSLCDSGLASTFHEIVGGSPLMTDKDRDGFTMQGWLADERSDQFALDKLVSLPQSDILVTGGSGLLGQELRRVLPEAQFPTSSELDISDAAQVEAYAGAHRIGVVLHAAAFTSPPRIDEDPVRALESNVIGTANVVKLCVGLACRLIYVSTDYVFRGDDGPYSEEDPVCPVNKYAWSKLGGECAARLYDRSLIVRTSFGPSEFPFPKAFTDQWTSRESVAVIAGKLKRLIESDATGVVHVGGARRTVMDYACSLDPSKEIGALSIHDVGFEVPVDTSLDCSRYDQLVDDTESGS